jgi:hypothetical protein
MSQAVCSQPRSSVQTKNAPSQPDTSIVPTVARNGNSAHRQPSQGARSAAASDLTRLLDADAVDLRDVGDAIRIHPELESLVLKLCEFLALSPGVPVSSAEEAAIVLGKDRLRIVVHAWSVNQWVGEAARGSQPEIPEGTTHHEESSPVPTARAAMAEGRHTTFLSTEFSAEILGLANLFHWARRDAVSFVNSRGENYAHRLDLELRQAAHLTNLLMRDLLCLVSLVNPADLSPEQEAMLQEILQVRS